MKRPALSGYDSQGNPYSLAWWQEKEENARLMTRVLEWRGIKKGAVKTCDRCGMDARSRKEFVIHHRHYRSFRNEKPEDVCLLCKPCHTEIHERSKNWQLTAEDAPFVDPEWGPQLRLAANPRIARSVADR